MSESSIWTAKYLHESTSLIYFCTTLVVLTFTVRWLMSHHLMNVSNSCGGEAQNVTLLVYIKHSKKQVRLYSFECWTQINDYNSSICICVLKLLGEKVQDAEEVFFVSDCRGWVEESHSLRNKAAVQSELFCITCQMAAVWAGCGCSGCFLKVLTCIWHWVNFLREQRLYKFSKQFVINQGWI